MRFKLVQGSSKAGLSPWSAAVSSSSEMGVAFRESRRNHLSRRGAEMIERKVWRGLAPRTIARDRQILRLLIRAVGDFDLRYGDGDAIFRGLESVSLSGQPHAAKRAAALLNAIYQDAVDRNHVRCNPAAWVARALPRHTATPAASLRKADDLRQYMQAVWPARYDSGTMFAAAVLPFLMVRPGEFRQAHWSEFDLRRGVWAVPAGRTKLRKPHKVPLAPPVVAVLDCAPSRLIGALVCPSPRDPHKPISDAAIGFAIRAAGFEGRATAVGFRRTASDFLRREGWNGDWIEKQLGHAVAKGRVAYDAGQHIKGRRAMMDAWADYLLDLAGDD